MSFRFASIVLSLLQVGSILAEDPELVVLIADSGLVNQRGALYKLTIHDFTINQLHVETIGRPVGIDFDKGEGLVYFTDTYTKQIRRVGINGGSEEMVARLNATSSALGLTLDLKTGQVFYTDYGNNLIGRVEIANFNHSVIVDTRLDKPRGIVADTKKKKLYWVDFGANPKIETSDYSGQQRSTVIFTNIKRPVGITLDEEDGRLYWTDVDKVESVGVDGKNRRTLVEKNHDLLYGISLFNGFLYYTDLNYTGLVSSTVNHEQFHFTYWRRFPVLKIPRGLHVFSPNFEITSQCPYGKYGKNCKDCGNCKLGAPCERTTGNCLGPCQIGYRTDNCNEICSPGTYGKWCSSQCSANCKLGSVCDFVNGTCPDGCRDGWMGETCTKEVPETKDGTPVGLIVGVVVGLSVVIIVLVVAVVFIIRKKKTRDTRETTTSSGVDNVNYVANNIPSGNATVY